MALFAEVTRGKWPRKGYRCLVMPQVWCRRRFGDASSLVVPQVCVAASSATTQAWRCLKFGDAFKLVMSSSLVVPQVGVAASFMAPQVWCRFKFGDVSSLVMPRVCVASSSATTRAGLHRGGCTLHCTALHCTALHCNVTVFRSTCLRWRGLELNLAEQGQRTFQWPGVFFSRRT